VLHKLINAFNYDLNISAHQSAPRRLTNSDLLARRPAVSRFEEELSRLGC